MAVDGETRRLIAALNAWKSSHASEDKDNPQLGKDISTLVSALSGDERSDEVSPGQQAARNSTPGGGPPPPSKPTPDAKDTGDSPNQPPWLRKAKS